MARFHRVLERAARLVEGAPVAYGTILALQLRAVWGMWWVRDLTSGDTSEYFFRGHGWFQDGSVNIAWSPLYTTFYGTLLHFTQDAYAATIAHRLIIVMGLAVLVLALMRRLTAPWAAWLITAWWAVLPINYDTMYEVHLFLAIPLVVACLVLVRAAPLARGTALAVLLGTTLLMRNELAIATAGLAVACAVCGARGVGRPRGRDFPSYAVPLFVAVMIAGLAYSRSTVKYPELSAALERKHSLNVCQIFAYGYQQRNPSWSSSPWTGCQDLMTRTFGAPELAMVDAIRRSPRDMWAHFRWNLGLVPSGIQLLLFNAASGRMNPDYAPAALENQTALALSLLWLALLGTAGLAAWGESQYWWRTWIAPRAWVWALLALFAITAFVVMVMQRPRPSYLFSLGLGLMAMTGLAVQIVVRRLGATNAIRHSLAGVVVALLLFLPTYATRNAGTPRPLLESYERLRRFVGTRGDSPAKVVSSGFPNELGNYFAQRGRFLDYYDLRREVSPPVPWSAVLARHDVGVIYLSEHAAADPLAGSLTETPHFETVIRGVSPRGQWLVMRAIDATP